MDVADLEARSADPRRSRSGAPRSGRRWSLPPSRWRYDGRALAWLAAGSALGLDALERCSASSPRSTPSTRTSPKLDAASTQPAHQHSSRWASASWSVVGGRWRAGERAGRIHEEVRHERPQDREARQGTDQQGHRQGRPVVETVDPDIVLEHIDINAGEPIDVNALLDRIDTERLLARIDMNALLANVDLEALVRRSGIPDIVAESTGSSPGPRSTSPCPDRGGRLPHRTGRPPPVQGGTRRRDRACHLLSQNGDARASMTTAAPAAPGRICAPRRRYRPLRRTGEPHARHCPGRRDRDGRIPRRGELLLDAFFDGRSTCPGR